MADEAQAEPPGGIWAARLAGGPCFACEPGSGDAQALEAFWRARFAEAPRDGAMLEIGCGSATVSLWAAEAGRGLRIVASDRLADVGATHRHRDIRYLAEAPAEALPVPSAGFDLVVANFAFEYADRGPAAVELARVLRPGGAAILVLHASDSGVSASSRMALKVNAMVEAADIPARVRRTAALPSHSLARGKLLRDLKAERARIPRPVVSFTGVEWFDLAERMARGGAVTPAEIEALARDVELRIAISREQLRVALDEPALGDLERRLRALGLSVASRGLTYRFTEAADVGKVCWTTVATKPAA